MRGRRDGTALLAPASSRLNRCLSPGTASAAGGSSTTGDTPRPTSHHSNPAAEGRDRLQRSTAAPVSLGPPDAPATSKLSRPATPPAHALADTSSPLAGPLGCELRAGIRPDPAAQRRRQLAPRTSATSPAGRRPHPLLQPGSAGNSRHASSGTASDRAEVLLPEASSPTTSLEMLVRVGSKPGAHSGEEANQADRLRRRRRRLARSPVPLDFSGVPTPFGLESFRLRFEEEGGAPPPAPAPTPSSSPPPSPSTRAPTRSPDPTAAQGPTGRPRQGHPLQVAPRLHRQPGRGPACSLAQFFTTSPASERQRRENLCPPQTARRRRLGHRHEPRTVGYITAVRAALQPRALLRRARPLRLLRHPAIAPVVARHLAALAAPAKARLPPKRRLRRQRQRHQHHPDSPACSPPASPSGASPATPATTSRAAGAASSEARGLLATRPCPGSEATHPPAFITLPTSCAGPMAASQEASSWAQPAAFDTAAAASKRCPPWRLQPPPLRPDDPRRTDLQRGDLAHRPQLRPQLRERRPAQLQPKGAPPNRRSRRPSSPCPRASPPTPRWPKG